MQSLQRETQPRGVRLHHVVHGEVQDLLDQLARALTEADLRAVAALWELPAFAIGPDGAHAITTIDELARHLTTGKRARADLIDLERVGERIVIAAVRWPQLDAATDYTFVRDADGSLKIRMMLMRGIAK